LKDEYAAGVDGPAETSSPLENEAAPDFVWSYRGYKLKSGEFTTAMAHFFRAEIARANVWRQRLDTTTNWAVVSTGASLTVAFSQPIGHHGILILTTLLVTLFLYIEARRYRYYELWSSRVRLMETDFFAAMLVPPFSPDPDWAESLAENLLHPDYPITMLEAIGRRLRRNYFWIYMILSLAWVARIALFPDPVTTWSAFVERAGIALIDGQLVVTAWIVGVSLIVLLALLTLGLHSATGEVLPRYDKLFPSRDHTQAGGKIRDWRAWFRPTQRRKQLMAMIITDKVQPVSDHILKEMRRGVTALQGIGMYTGKQHGVLITALTVTEVNHLKSLVGQEDPHAFVIVSPAQDVLGAGFSPLEDAPQKTGGK
jgi:uncharacterized membrane protein